jgi:hypothetical protein
MDLKLFFYKCLLFLKRREHFIQPIHFNVTEVTRLNDEYKEFVGESNSSKDRVYLDKIDDGVYD